MPIEETGMGVRKGWAAKRAWCDPWKLWLRTKIF